MPARRQGLPGLARTCWPTRVAATEQVALRFARHDRSSWLKRTVVSTNTTVRFHQDDLSSWEKDCSLLGKRPQSFPRDIVMSSATRADVRGETHRRGARGTVAGLKARQRRPRRAGAAGWLRGLTCPKPSGRNASRGSTPLRPAGPEGARKPCRLRPRPAPACNPAAPSAVSQRRPTPACVPCLLLRPSLLLPRPRPPSLRPWSG